jgi:hypothetical protein
VIAYRSDADATPPEVLAAVEATITELILDALHPQDGPLAGACARAARFLRGWWGDPPDPPFAPSAVQEPRRTSWPGGAQSAGRPV